MSGPRVLIRPRIAYDASGSEPLPDEVLSLRSGARTSTENGLVPLNLNCVSQDELVSIFQGAQGFGPVSARKIVAERDRAGPFSDFEDLDRRVTGLTCRRLLSAFSLSFSLPKDASCGLSSGCVAGAERVEKLLSNLVLSEPRPRDSDTAPHSGTETDRAEEACIPADVVFATFNACRLSPKSERFEKKLLMLQRFVDDTPGLTIILLQELFGNAVARIAKHLTKATGNEWLPVGCGADDKEESVFHHHAHQYGCTCQAAVFQSSAVRCVASSYVEAAGTHREVEQGFVRPPHVCVFERVTLPAGGRARPSRLLCVANVHLSQREPRREIIFLSKLAESIRAACALALRLGDAKGLLREDVVTVLAGDFNRPSDSSDFSELKEAGFVELVAPVGRDGELPVLSDATSCGGGMLDNIFMPRDTRRKHLRDAWVYRLGGAGRRLQETQHESVGRLRSERSDHMPVVAQLRLGLSAELDSVADGARSWACKRPFVIQLASRRGGQR